MKLIFDFLYIADWWCTNSGFFTVSFCVKLEGPCFRVCRWSLWNQDVTVRGHWVLFPVFLSSNFNVGYRLFIVCWKIGLSFRRELSGDKCRQHISDLLGQVFRLKEGLPMGFSISSGTLAILFMDRLETTALSSHLSISHYEKTFTLRNFPVLHNVHTKF